MRPCAAESSVLAFTVMKTALMITLLLIALGCSEDDAAAPESVPSFVAGYVKYDATVKTPVPDAEVFLVEYRTSSGPPGLPEPTGWQNSVCTTATGYFSFEFNAKRFAEYHAEVYTTSGTHEEVVVPEGNTKYLTLWLPSNLYAQPCN